MRSPRALAALVAIAAALAAPAPRAEDAPATSAAAAELGAIREKLVALDLEGAIASANALLARAGLATDDRARALALRAEAHVAGGDVEAAAADYKEILPLDPAFAPDPSATSKKALERFRRVQASLVGTAHLDLDPKDASVTIDGRAIVPNQGALKVLAGDRRARFERLGFDPLELTVHAVAGQDTIVTARLVPNARDLIVATDVGGVVVTMDGAQLGETRAAGSGLAELLVPAVAIGEHAIRLQKSCFATESIPVQVSVDLADRAPKRLPAVTMRAAATRVTAQGASYAGEIRVDGRRVAATPAASFTMCPGRRAIQAVASGRVVWSGVVEAEEGDLTLDLGPRPSAVLVGDEWPASWGAFVGGVSLVGRVPRPEGADLSSVDAWKRLGIPKDADLAVAFPAGAGSDEPARAFVYSPAIGAVATTSAPPAVDRPRWTAPSFGVDLADGPGGSVVVAQVRAGSAAASKGLAAGDRIVSVGGKPAAGSAAVRARLEAASPGASIAVEYQTPGGPTKRADLAVELEPQVSGAAQGAAAIVRGAWSQADGSAGGPGAASAWANLAALLERRGRSAAARTAWARAKALDPDRFGARADYAAGVELADSGKTSEAIEAFRQLRDAARAKGDLVLAAAAGDRLADLGVAR